MKKKVSKLICMTLILCMLMSINVFAQEGNLGNSETIAVEQSEFEKVIEEILQIQKSNPMMTEEEILVTMDAKFDNAKEARGISEIWNVLTDAEKKLCIRYPFDELPGKNILYTTTWCVTYSAWDQQKRFKTLKRTGWGIRISCVASGGKYIRTLFR